MPYVEHFFPSLSVSPPPLLSIVSVAKPSDRFPRSSVLEYFEKNNLSSRSDFPENRWCIKSEGCLGNVCVPLQGVLIGIQKVCVYCAVRTEFLIVIQVNLSLQNVSRITVL